MVSVGDFDWLKELKLLSCYWNLGSNLYIPFFKPNIAVSQNAETDRVFNDTNLPPAQGHYTTMERIANMKESMG